MSCETNSCSCAHQIQDKNTEKPGFDFGSFYKSNLIGYSTR